MVKIIWNKSKMEDLPHQIFKAAVIGRGIDKYTSGTRYRNHNWPVHMYIAKIALQISEERVGFSISGSLTSGYPYGIKWN